MLESVMVDQAEAPLLRLWAAQYLARAKDARASDEERNRHVKMGVGLLELAEMQDWLEGHPTTRHLQVIN
jgi:hypothetical protein